MWNDGFLFFYSKVDTLLETCLYTVSIDSQQGFISLMGNAWNNKSCEKLHPSQCLSSILPQLSFSALSLLIMQCKKHSSFVQFIAEFFPTFFPCRLLLPNTECRNSKFKLELEQWIYITVFLQSWSVCSVSALELTKIRLERRILDL